MVPGFQLPSACESRLARKFAPIFRQLKQVYVGCLLYSVVHAHASLPDMFSLFFFFFFFYILLLTCHLLRVRLVTSIPTLFKQNGIFKLAMAYVFCLTVLDVLFLLLLGWKECRTSEGSVTRGLSTTKKTSSCHSRKARLFRTISGKTGVSNTNLVQKDNPIRAFQFDTIQKRYLKTTLIFNN